MLVATHDGDFHADEVFAIAALRLILPTHELEVIRTRDPERLEKAFCVVDVGGVFDPKRLRFDHHQPGGAGSRTNGIDYASFGLVWKEQGLGVCGAVGEIHERIDRSLVQWVDANDNGQDVVDSKLAEGGLPLGLGGLIGAFNPRWFDEPEPGQTRAELENERFAAAVDFAEGILRRELRSVGALWKAQDKVAEAIREAADPQIIELEEKMPWRETVLRQAPEALFVIYPKSEGWGLQAVPRELGRFDNRKDLPAEWAGLAGSELAEVSGVADASFCHRARFFAAASSREGAYELARLALAA